MPVPPHQGLTFFAVMPGSLSPVSPPHVCATVACPAQAQAQQQARCSVPVVGGQQMAVLLRALAICSSLVEDDNRFLAFQPLVSQVCVCVGGDTQRGTGLRAGGGRVGGERGWVHGLD